MVKKKEKQSFAQKMLKKAKIEKLPKDVSSSLPFRGISPSGIVETKAGHFTKQYHLEDINFQLAPTEEQKKILDNYIELLNSFPDNVRWQFSIFSHKVNKQQTMNDIKIAPRNDGLNNLRREMNGVLLTNLIKGNCSVVQDKYLTVSIEDINQEHATEALKRTDQIVSSNLRKITQHDTRPMTAVQRIKLLYQIYNQDSDYRYDLVEDNEKEQNGDTLLLKEIEKQGISIKDFIGPSSMDWSPKNYFMLGETYGRSLYLKKTGARMNTDFMADLTDLSCPMLISIYTETQNTTESIKMLNTHIAELTGEMAARAKNNMEDGYMAPIATQSASQNAAEAASELLKEVTDDNMKLMFTTFLVTVFAETKDILDEYTEQVKAICSAKQVAMHVAGHQQEFCFNTCLPLARNDVVLDRLYTTETNSVFIPFKSKEILQKNSLFYGINSTTKNMILYDRMSGNNYNGLVLGASGSGKSFTVKCEIAAVLLKDPNVQVFVIDPMGEYFPMAGAFGGSRIKLETGGKSYINPLDLDITGDDESGDPVSAKSDFIMGMLEFMAGGNAFDPRAKSIIDRCVRQIYRPYVEAIVKRTDGVTCDPSMAPTLNDLYVALGMQNNDIAEEIRAYLEPYTIGSFGLFARRTNVITDARLIIFDMKKLTTGVKPLALHICTSYIWNAMMENDRHKKITRFYIDEFHLLLSTPSSAIFMERIWRMARKWKGVPTGITQGIEEMIASPQARAILKNTSFLIALHVVDEEANNLQQLLNLPDSLVARLTNDEKGQGIIKTGKLVLPFEYKFPTNTRLYKIMSTTSETVESA